jgi:hypothetical protein
MSQLKRFDQPICYLLILGSIVSLFLPACRTNNELLYGWGVAAVGWLGLLRLQTGWLGNILLFCVVLSAPESKRAAKVQSVLLIFPIASALNWHEVPDANESHRILEFGTGYYLWVTVMVCALLLCLVRCFYDDAEKRLSV